MPIPVKSGAAFPSIPVITSDAGAMDTMISLCCDDATRQAEIGTQYSILVDHNE